jgi:hypothetical protein
MQKRIRSHIRSNVVGYVALFFALSGGVAFATHPGGANTINSADIINGEVKNNDLGENSVGSGKIADQSVKNNDLSLGASSSNTIADDGVQSIDIKNETLTDNDLADGAATPDKIGTVPVVRATEACAGGASGATVGHGGNLDDDGQQIRWAASTDTVSTMHTPEACPGAGVDAARLFAPRDGWYQVSGGLIWSPNATGTRLLAIIRQDISGPQAGCSNFEHNVAGVETPVNSATAGTQQNVSGLTFLNQNDCVSLSAIQTSGGDLDIAFPVSDGRNFFSMVWLGPP